MLKICSPCYGRQFWQKIPPDHEWLIANGIGGYASSTIIGMNTRRYHGLLVASLKPPVDRRLILSKLEEEVVYRGKHYFLSANHYLDTVFPSGYLNLREFVLAPFPTFIYGFEDVLLKKRIFLVYGENTAVITYDVMTASEPLFVKITPLLTCRSHHSLQWDEGTDFQQEIQEKLGNEVNITLNREIPLFTLAGSLPYIKQETIYHNLYYQKEKEKGLDFTENLYAPGCFQGELKTKETASITATLNLTVPKDIEQLYNQQKVRQQELIFSSNPLTQRLLVAADAFLVKRDSHKTIIAGYPHFTDWGRDSMIALEGLTLATRRYSDGKEILRTFLNQTKEGLVPNSFTEDGQDVLYNSVDAGLWLFYAMYKYYQYTKDTAFIKESMPQMETIINSYIKGTLFNIKTDEDGLLSAGQEGIQLTWMDAKVDDEVITARSGKPVEINALWYNALKIFNFFAKELLIPPLFEELAEKVKENFATVFWNEEKGYLYDCINENEKNDQLRPNQIFAVSLPFSLLPAEKEKQIVQKVWEKLYTPFGLRSLSGDDPNYKGRYEGDRNTRDRAYHQGTVWSFLMGPFITAYLKVNSYSPEAKEVARELISPLWSHLDEAGAGCISEIFDGDSLHRPAGCTAQAWSTAELLRLYQVELKKDEPKEQKIIQQISQKLKEKVQFTLNRFDFRPTKKIKAVSGELKQREDTAYLKIGKIIFDSFEQGKIQPESLDKSAVAELFVSLKKIKEERLEKEKD